MAKRKTSKKKAQRLSGDSAKKAPKKPGARNSLVANINKRKKAGISRSKKDSTVSDAAYADMKLGWPKKGTKAGKE